MSSHGVARSHRYGARGSRGVPGPTDPKPCAGPMTHTDNRSGELQALIDTWENRP